MRLIIDGQVALELVKCCEFPLVFKRRLSFGVCVKHHIIPYIKDSTVIDEVIAAHWVLDKVANEHVLEALYRNWAEYDL